MAARGADAGLPQRNLPARGRSRSHADIFVHHTKIDEMTEDLVEGDKGQTKTWSRIVVEKFLQYRAWYFPGKNNKHPEAPSLEKAWAYYEHFTLARHFVGRSAAYGLERSEPGEEGQTALYSPFTTPESSLIEFGIGVASYFSTLRIVAFIILIAGTISAVNISFFASDRYSGGQDQISLSRFFVRGSAVCTETQWVVCSDCDPSNWNSPEERNRLATFDQNGEQTVLVLQNICGRPELVEGMVNLGSLGFLLVAFFLLDIYQRKRETLFDQEKQTATDYSLVVKNPPKDAYDPEKWRIFFSQFAEKQISAITVALDNHKLVQKLIDRRILRNKLRAQLPKGVDMEDEDAVRVHVANIMQERELDRPGFCGILCGCTLLPILRLFKLFLPPDALVDKIFALTDTIRELQKDRYDVAEVYVTFETEAGQRTALEALSTSKLNISFNLTDRIPPSTVFEGKVLHVKEPPEPNSVRWLEIQVHFLSRLIQQSITFIITILLIAGAGFLVNQTRQDLGARYSGPVTTVFNTLIPLIVKLLLLIEKHPSEGYRQQSLYLKVTLFRWVNTAILTLLITPFMATIDDDSKDVIPAISSILLSELWLSPLLRLMDLSSNMRKHILGPRAKTQEAMNLSFQGTYYNLGERYTDFTKNIFVCFFYSALYPGIFFFVFAILMIQYFVDKFCLMRIWAPAPFVGTQLAKFSRRYFFWGALLTYGIVSSYAWAQFPYDSLCDDPNPTVGFEGIYSPAVFANMTSGSITVTQTENAVFCDQSWRGFSFVFPAVSGVQGDVKWMTPDQARLADIYGWASVALLALIGLGIFGGLLRDFLTGLVTSTYKPSGIDAKIDFQDVAEISAYVPQFKLGAFQYPVLACDVDDFIKTWIGWTDPDSVTYDDHNLIFDVPIEGMREKTRGGGAKRGVETPVREKWPIYSIVKSYERESQEERHEAYA